MLSPKFIFTFSWILISTLTLYFKSVIGNINIETYFFIFINIIIFNLIAYIIEKKSNIKKIYIKKINRKKMKYKKTYIIFNIFLLLYIFIILKNNFNFDRSLIGSLRANLNYGNFSYGILGYLMEFYINSILYLYVIFIFRRAILNKFYIFFNLIIGFIYLLFLTNRLNMILYFISIFIIFSFKEGIKIKNIIKLIFISSFIFYFIGMITKKMDDIRMVFISYGPLALRNFDNILNNGYFLEYGKFTFSFFIKILEKLGIREKTMRMNVISTNNGYFILNSKLLTNVPTMYGRLIKDFGVFYCFFITAFISWISTVIYKKAKLYETMYIYLYSYIGGFLFFSFYDEFFFRIVLHIIKIVVTGLVVEKVFFKNI